MGALIGHYTQAETTKGKTEVGALITKHKADLANGKAYVFAEVDFKEQSTYLAKSQVEAFVKMIKDDLGLTATIKKYIEPSSAHEIGSASSSDEDMSRWSAKLEAGQANYKYGAVLVSNAGDGSAASTIEWMDVAKQTA